MKKVKLGLLTAFLMVLMLAGCGKKAVEIDPSEYFKLTFEGYDGYGSFVSIEFDASQMKDDFEDPLEDVSKSKLTKLFGECVKIRISKDGKYSNGDKISLEWDVDEDKLAEFEKENKVSVKLEDFEYTVSGLTPVEKFDPFEGIVITPNGMSGSATLSITNTLYSFLYIFNKYP